ncbi:MAG TPA: cupredoxin family copper-binding protein [Candidatus Binatia bacterium]|nr:cupredoxin family copper-binding protein [Candidatus Binatia bacterium]
MKYIPLFALAVLLVACSATTTQQSAGTQADQVVSINNFKFSPATITVKVGQSVLWKNEDAASHTVKIDDTESPELFKGDAWTHTFSKAGTYAYSCGIHPSMKGTVVVEE